MCVLIFYLNPSETSPTGYKLIMISIRDELFSRPTAPAAFWNNDPNLIGGEFLKRRIVLSSVEMGIHEQYLRLVGAIQLSKAISLKGMDLEPGREGGAWLVFNKNGRFASLLNVLQRDVDLLAGKRGRGFLVVDFAKSGSTTSTEDYAQVRSSSLSTLHRQIDLLLDFLPLETMTSYFLL